MDTDQFDYFPSNAFMFWWFTVGPLVILLMALLLGKEWQFIVIVLGAGFICIAIPTVLGNAHPAIRVGISGVSICFYFPFFTRWIELPWKDITSIQAYTNSADQNIFRRGRRPSIIVISDRLPFYYYTPMLLLGKPFHRGFLITNNIRRYDILLRSFPEFLTRDLPPT